MRHLASACSPATRARWPAPSRWSRTAGPRRRELLAALFPHAGRSLVVGVTGPPGAGKSSLVDRLTAHLRRAGPHASASIAVDPTSPFSGGAILGDRIRMQAHATDPGVFIRSMATRGHLGGLAAATDQVLMVLERRGQGRDPGRDGGRRPGRGGDRRHGGREPGGARAGPRRRGAGAQGRDHGDRRRVRRQQGRPRRRRARGGRDPVDADAGAARRAERRRS